MIVTYYSTIMQQITAMLIHHHIALEKVNYIVFNYFLTTQIHESAAATLNDVTLWILKCHFRTYCFIPYNSINNSINSNLILNYLHFRHNTSLFCVAVENNNKKTNLQKTHCNAKQHSSCTRMNQRFELMIQMIHSWRHSRQLLA